MKLTLNEVLSFQTLVLKAYNYKRTPADNPLVWFRFTKKKDTIVIYHPKETGGNIVEVVIKVKNSKHTLEKLEEIIYADLQRLITWQKQEFEKKNASTPRSPASSTG